MNNQSHNNTVQAILIVGVACIVIAGGLWLGMSSFFAHTNSMRQSISPSNNVSQGQTAATTTQISLNDAQFTAQIVDTPALREQGLSGRQSIGENEAMMFIFPSSDRYGFWMKDMLFSIDMIWTDEQGEIVYIKEHATPESYPEPFIPTAPARVVIEVHDGIVKEHKIKIGDTLNFDKNILKNASN